jgi:bacillithiol system protein YtxJ
MPYDPLSDREPQRTNFTRVPDEATLEALLTESAERPVVVFLHDQFCPISSYAYEEMEVVGGRVEMVDVTTDHEVKRAVETKTGVRHASPQLIVLRNGQVSWHASHGRIQTAAVQDAIAEAAH